MKTKFGNLRSIRFGTLRVNDTFIEVADGIGRMFTKTLIEVTVNNETRVYNAVSHSASLWNESTIKTFELSEMVYVQPAAALLRSLPRGKNFAHGYDLYEVELPHEKSVVAKNLLTGARCIIAGRTAVFPLEDVSLNVRFIKEEPEPGPEPEPEPEPELEFEPELG